MQSEITVCGVFTHVRSSNISWNHPGVHALRLELAPLGTVRDLIQKKLPSDPLPEQTRLQICRDVADGSLTSTHGACGTRILVFGTLYSLTYRIKIGDFGGSIIEGHESSFPVMVAKEVQYELPCRGRDNSPHSIWLSRGRRGS